MRFRRNAIRQRPAIDARSVSEVLAHVAAGNFFLLAHVGVPLPPELYPALPAAGPERVLAIIAVNDGMERTTTDKAVILSMLKCSFELARTAAAAITEEELTRRLDEATTVRRVYLRLLSHAHEHMGQLIAYLRVNDIRAPWPDWRPDRRPPA